MMKYTFSALATVFALTTGSAAFAADVQSPPAAAAGASQAAPQGSGAPWWSRHAKPGTAPPAAVASSSAAAAPAPEAPPAAATPAASASPSTPEPAASATPLATRPTAPKPLNFASDSSSTPWHYKVGAGVVVAAAAALYMRNKKRQKATKKKPARIDILARQSVGVRSDLLVVEVEGQRLFLGMTPHAIQTLMVLEDAPVEASDDEESTDVVETSSTKKMKAKRAAAAAAEDEAEESLLAGLVQARDRAVISRPSKTSMTAPRRASSRQMNPVHAETSAEVHAADEQVGARVRSLLTHRASSSASQQMKAIDAAQLAAGVAKPRLSSPKLHAAGQAKGLLLALEEEQQEEALPKKRLGDW